MKNRGNLFSRNDLIRMMDRPAGEETPSEGHSDCSEEDEDIPVADEVAWGTTVRAVAVFLGAGCMGGIVLIKSWVWAPMKTVLQKWI